jgi:hypothetical protein
VLANYVWTGEGIWLRVTVEVRLQGFDLDLLRVEESGMV